MEPGSRLVERADADADVAIYSILLPEGIAFKSIDWPLVGIQSALRRP